MTDGAFYYEGRRTIWQRLGFGHASIPEPPEPYPDGFVKGGIISETYVSLDFPDRLRALISGRIHVTARTLTSVVVDRAVSTSRVAVLPPGRKGDR